VPSLLVSLPIWIRGRRRTSWFWSDYATAVVPFVVWAALFLHNGSDKSLANVAEGLWLGCVVPVAAVVRVLIGKRGNERLLSVGFLV
jgi:hypothetical protein